MLVVLIAAGFAVARDVARLREVRREPGFQCGDAAAHQAGFAPLAAQGLDALGSGQGKKIWRRHGLLSVVWLRLCALLWAKLFGRRL